MKGRKPKPIALKILDGTATAAERAAAAPRPHAGKTDPPLHLSADAKKEWRRVAKTLVSLGLLTPLDRAALAVYCQAWSRWVKAEAKVAEGGEVLTSGEGGTYQNPWIHVANKAMEQMAKALAEFGMSPSSRQRVHAMPPAPVDPLEELLADEG